MTNKDIRPLSYRLDGVKGSFKGGNEALALTIKKHHRS